MLTLVFGVFTQTALAGDITPFKPSETPANVSAAPPVRMARQASPSGDPVCFAQIGTGETFSSTDSRAVQGAVDAAVTGDLVKVAGTCAGIKVMVINNNLFTQTVYISKTLTLQGGYSQNDWSPAGNPTTLDAQRNGRVILVLAGASVTVTEVTIVNGSVPLTDCGSSCWGGGVYVDTASSVLLDHSTLSNNSAFFGGGVANAGALTVDHSTFSSNYAKGVGGGLYNFNIMSVTASLLISNSAVAGGAGLGNQGFVTVTDSTIAANISDNHQQPGLLSKGSGGGFQNATGDILNPIATFINSTIANNEARGTNDEGGGGIIVFIGSVNLLNTTVVGNRALANYLTGGSGRDAGGITGMLGTTTTLQNSIVASNTAAHSRPDLGGKMVSKGGNVFGSTNGATIVKIGTIGDRAGNNTTLLNPLLGPLGTTDVTLNTLPLLPGSPAIGILTGTGCNGAPPKDQRGQDRPFDGCDAGAYEQRGWSIDIDSWGGGGQSTFVNSNFTTPLTIEIHSYYNEPIAGGYISFVSPPMGPGTNPITTVALINDNGVVDGELSGIVSVVLRANNLKGSYTVTATASGLAGVNTPATFDLSNDPLPIDLRIALEVTPTEAVPGQAVTYTLVFSNGGPGTANGTLITDIMPPELTNIVYTHTGTFSTELTGPRFQWNIGNLLAGMGGVVTITGIISPNLGGVSTIANTAIIAASDTDNNASSVDIAVLYGLSVTADGNGHGSLTIDPAGPIYRHGTDITVYPTPDDGSNLSAWSTNCTVVDDQCHLTLTSTMAVTATFTLVTHTLIVTTAGNGHGEVLVNPITDHYNHSAVVTLTALTNPGSVFTGWSGDISSTQNTYTLTIHADTTVIANFDSLPIDLRITLEVTPTKATPGQAVTYTLVFSNAGPGTANSTLITDIMPSSLTNIVYTYTGATLVKQGKTPYRWSVDNLPAGASGIVTITGNISADLNGESSITNTALIGATDVETSTDSTATIAMWYVLRAAADGNGHGRLSFVPPGPTYPYGTNVIVSHTLDTGSKLGTWSAFSGAGAAT
jgi:uncharacterized repeat protein (TIGR01451 family)